MQNNIDEEELTDSLTFRYIGFEKQLENQQLSIRYAKLGIIFVDKLCN